MTDVVTKTSQRKRLYVQTYGCQMNVYDSEKLIHLLEGEYELASSLEEADLVLVNTCSVRDKPERKLYSYLGRVRQIKQQHPELIVGVGGCIAQHAGRQIIERAPVVDFVFGTHNLSLVPGLIEACKRTGEPQVAVDFRDGWEENLLPGLSSDRVGPIVFVAISRGCSRHCTYCIVPQTRGPEVSRDPMEIEREVRLLLEQGAREIVFLGQTVNSYGRDLRPRLTFTELLERIATLPQVERIRFTSPHPRDFHADFVDLLARCPKICRQVHLPVQSGSNRILRLMRRGYQREHYLDIVDTLRTTIPDLALSTDLIVGFPGETEEEFEMTLDLMEQVRFQSSFSFIFSPRPGTPAAVMSDQIPEEIKRERLQRLQALQDRCTFEALQSWLGRTVEVLVEGPSPHDHHEFQGRTSQNFMVNLKRCSHSLEPGMVVNVLVSDMGRNTLRGEVLSVKDVGKPTLELAPMQPSV